MDNTSTTVNWSDRDALVDKEALAIRHKRSPRSVERDIQRGVGAPHLKVGKKTLFRVRDVLAWEEDHLFGSTAEAKAATGCAGSDPPRRDAADRGC